MQKQGELQTVRRNRRCLFQASITDFGEYLPLRFNTLPQFPVRL